MLNSEAAGSIKTSEIYLGLCSVTYQISVIVFRYSTIITSNCASSHCLLNLSLCRMASRMSASFQGPVFTARDVCTFFLQCYVIYLIDRILE